jgi:type IV secretory pathway ATPase VirB11/archaellum biosynthesis ATPase
VTSQTSKKTERRARLAGRTPSRAAESTPSASSAQPTRSAILASRSTNRRKYIVQDLEADEAARAQVREMQEILLRTMPVPDSSQSPIDALKAAFVSALARLTSPPTDSNMLWTRVVREFLGYGRIDVLMADPLIEEITCDGPGIPLFIYHRKHGAMETNVVFTDEAELDGFVIRLAQMCNREITYARPMLEATLPDGGRLQASLSREITTRGSSFTIRRFLLDPMTPLDLISYGTLDARLAAFLWMAIEGKQSVLFVGGTASGKTTTLNACCAFIPQDEKIVSIEDTRELTLPQLNWTAGLTRPAGHQESGQDAPQTIDMYKLLATALRQRPDYILVGEVRGPEAVTLFQAMATGHATMSTMHADSPLTAVRRLENPPINVPRNLIEALGLVVMHRRAPEVSSSARRIYEVSEVSGIDSGTGDLLMRVLFRWDPKTDTHEYLGRSGLLDRLAEARGEADSAQKLWEERTALLTNLAKDPHMSIGQLMQHLSRVENPASATSPQGQADELGSTR